MQLLVRLVIFCCLVCAGHPGHAGAPVGLLQIDGSISPATSDYIERGFARAGRHQVQLLIIRMNTPGGLDTAMREIVQTILNSATPVAVFVAPAGARAASAGTYILYAANIAAMAPGTNIGAATPVRIGGKEKLPGPDIPGGAGDPVNDDEGTGKPGGGDAMDRKIINDAVAYLRSLAQLRGRSESWAEKAVREAASLSAEEALDSGVIDLLADDTTQLLKKLDKRQLNFRNQSLTLDTLDAAVVNIEPDWRTRLLSVIADPNVAYILILIGIYGLIFEFYNPGFLFPGVVGAICLILALFALQVLPVNYAGLGLIILGIAFMVAEAFAPSFGVLGIGGLCAFLIGSIILIDTDMPGYGISMPLIIAFSATSALFFFGVLGMAIKARKRPVVSGQEELVGATGIASQDLDGAGYVLVHGETWRAVSQQPVKKGQPVKVTRLDGLTLFVDPIQEK